MKDNNFLEHYGILGMHWGRRKGIIPDRQHAFNKKDLEKLNNGGHLRIGLTKDRQAAYDKIDRQKLEKAIADHETKRALKQQQRKNKILSSPKLLAKHIDEFSKDEIDTAINRMRLHRDLRQLDIGEIKKGSDYVNAYLALGTSAVAAYGLYKSPLGQKLAEGFKTLK